MNKKIKIDAKKLVFSGKRLDNGEEITGNYVDARNTWQKGCFIYYIAYSERMKSPGIHRHEVHPESVECNLEVILTPTINRRENCERI